MPSLSFLSSGPSIPLLGASWFGNFGDPRTYFPLPSSPSLGSPNFLTWNRMDLFTLMGCFSAGS